MLYGGTSQVAPVALGLSSQLFISRNQPIQITVAGLASASLNGPITWMGENDNGQPVSNGTYYLKLEALDSFGSSRTITESVAVAGSLGEHSFALYNGAGELVREIALPGNAALTDFGAPQGTVLPADGSGLPLMLMDASGLASLWAFDGKNGSGAPLSSGSYTLKLVRKEMGSSSVIKTLPFTVIQAPQSSAQASAASALAGPNPVLGKADKLLIRFTPLATGGAGAGLYNVAGELISQAWVSASAGKLEIAVGGLSSGIYAVEFDIREGNVLLARKALKFVIVR